MANIYFNDKLRRNLNQALFTSDYLALNSYYGFRTGYVPPFGYGVIKLMKGTVPVDFSALTVPSSRASDTLVTWNAGLGTWTFNNPTTSVEGTAIISSPYATATDSGIASWFWWYVPKNSDTQIVLQLAGTVGTSGTDLIIGDTTIIAGANYRFQNLKFDIPTVYTY